MNRRKRIGLLIGLSALFVIVAPIVILLSFGYRYDASTGRLQRTGILMVSSLPKQAKIFLNGKKTNVTTPATVRFLAPGEYDLRLQKPGYRVWEKHVTIFSDRLTRTNYPNRPITLFTDQTRPALVATSTLDLAIHGNTIFAIAATSTLYAHNLNTGEKIPIAVPATASTDTAITAVDQNWIMLKSNGAFFAVAFGQKLVLSISALEPTTVEVHPLDKNTLLVLTKDNTLLVYDVRTKSLTPRHRRVQTAATVESQFYFLSDAGLFRQHTASTAPEKLSDLPSVFSSARIISAASGYVFVLLDGNLYLLEKNLQLLARDIREARWDDDAGKLLLWNMNTVLLFDPRSGNPPEAIIRSTSPIREPVINATDGVIFYEENQKLKAIEEELVIRRIITELLTFDSPIRKFVVDREGKTAYYLMTDGKLYKVEIR